MSEFIFLHNRAYQIPVNARKFTPVAKGTWCWAVLVSDLEDFYQIYNDQDWVAIRPRRSAKVFAYSWAETEAYVMRRSDELPTREVFDSSKHCLVKDLQPFRCWCGCGRGGSNYLYFESRFAILVEGSAFRRRTTGIQRMRRRHRESPINST